LDGGMGMFIADTPVGEGRGAQARRSMKSNGGRWHASSIFLTVPNR